jgi:hypothetical protein
VTATASFDCGAHEVRVKPTSLSGDFTVYSIAWVYDKTTGGWTTAPGPPPATR